MTDQEIPQTEREWRAHLAFHKLTVAQRNEAWRDLAAAEAGLIEARQKIEALTKENQTLAKQNQRLLKENEAFVQKIERLWKKIDDEGTAE